MPLFAAALAACATFVLRAEIRPIDNKRHHLGVVGKPEWDIFTNSPPEAEQLKLNFESHPNLREFTLFIRQDDVKQDWSVTLNGRKLGNLFLMEADLVQTLAIPPNSLREGPNELRISTKTVEDIVINGIEVGDDSKEKLLDAGPVTFSVRESGSRQLIPSRLTIVEEGENRTRPLSPIYDFGSTNLATRPGVVYTANGTARLRLLPRKYTIYATRGPEYTMAIAKGFDPRHTNQLELTIERRANTTGWIASDTHIHTFELSKHGDATLRERMITLAGEGIELPISTEHNLHADYEPTIKALGLERYMTPVRGNEVTTAKGHFNIFPVETGAAPPNAKEESWPDLMKQIRATPHVQVAILNHATDTHSGFTPFASTNLNFATGRNLRGDFDFTFDAMELINSGAMRSDWMEPFRAWFALLNRGYKITGVGASDSHDVSRFIVGQGRTYIRVDDADVRHIDIGKACEALKKGHALVSLGCIAQMKISEPHSDKTAGPGDLFSPRGDTLEVSLTVDYPLAPFNHMQVTTWANGVRSNARKIVKRVSSEDGCHQEILFEFQKPRLDTFYVPIVTIPTFAVLENPAPGWGLARPYQPTESHFQLQMIATVNPIWIDADGDGQFSSARDYASQLVVKFPSMPDLLAELRHYDYYVAAQCAELLRMHGKDLHAREFVLLLEQAGAETQRGFVDALGNLR